MYLVVWVYVHVLALVPAATPTRWYSTPFQGSARFAFLSLLPPQIPIPLFYPPFNPILQIYTSASPRHPPPPSLLPPSPHPPFTNKKAPARLDISSGYLFVVLLISFGDKQTHDLRRHLTSPPILTTTKDFKKSLRSVANPSSGRNNR
ncbi:hypothetical protein K440DRAFT_83839 [Wilcoxina mikolae CBS 423.85]|nr:hypothetical protein K440DRAFT_83839 [Wilcoxina mikolae CBS 423.85]